MADRDTPSPEFEDAWESRPGGGLYQLVLDGDVRAAIEVGRETDLWWFVAYAEDGETYGRKRTLGAAKLSVWRALWQD